MTPTWFSASLRARRTARSSLCCSADPKALQDAFVVAIECHDHDQLRLLVLEQLRR
jgi:hypothetical protein